MIPKNLTIQNFLSFAEANIDFGRGAHLVLGRNIDASAASSNGSGKSSLLDAITWCLYGKTLRNIGADDVVKIGAVRASVQLDFVSDNAVVQVLRTRDAKGSNLSLCVDGQYITKSTINATQDTINQIMGADYPTFCMVAAIGPQAIRFAGSSDKEQKDILERLLTLDAYANALKKVRAECVVIHGAINSSDGAARSHKAYIETERNNIALAQTTLNTLLKTLDAYNANSGTELAILESTLQHKTREKQERQTILINIKDANADKIETQKQIVKAAQDAMNIAVSESVQAQTILGRLNAQLLKAVADVQAVQTKLGKPCVACGRNVTENELGDVVNSLTIVKTEAQNAVDAANITNESKFTRRTELTYKAAEERGVLVALENANAANVKVREEIMEHIITLSHDINSLNNNIHKKKAARSEIENEIKSKQDEIVRRQNNLVGYEEQLVRFLDGITKNQHRLKDLEFWEVGFGYSGIRALLLENSLRFLTAQTNAYLRKLTNGNISVEFSSQTKLKTDETREKIELKIYNTAGANSYEGSSGGERQRVDVAISLALHSLAMTRAAKFSGIFMFDEIFERLDDSGCESVAQLLCSEEFANSTVLVVSHNPALQQYFQRQILVEKKNGESSIISGVACAG